MHSAPNIAHQEQQKKLLSDATDNAIVAQKIGISVQEQLQKVCLSMIYSIVTCFTFCFR